LDLDQDSGAALGRDAAKLEQRRAADALQHGPIDLRSAPRRGGLLGDGRHLPFHCMRPQVRGIAAQAAASWRIMAAPFSAIMMVGALVLAVVTVGMTEASTTRRPARPRTFSLGSTTAIGSSPIRHVPTM